MSSRRKKFPRCMFPEEFAEFVAKSRYALNKTQEEMGETLGVPYRTYQNWEYGVTVPCGIRMYKVVQKIYKLRRELYESNASSLLTSKSGKDTNK